MCVTDAYLRKKGELKAQEAQEASKRHFTPIVEEKDQRIEQITQVLTSTQDENAKLQTKIRQAENNGRNERIKNLSTIAGLNERNDAQASAMETEASKRQIAEDKYLGVSYRRDELEQRVKNFDATLSDLSTRLFDAEAKASSANGDLERVTADLAKVRKERDLAVQDPDVRKLLQQKDQTIDFLNDQICA